MRTIPPATAVEDARMDIETLSWNRQSGWGPASRALDADLVLYFGDRDLLAEVGWFDEMRRRYPRAHLAGCSSATQISGDDLVEDAIAGVALRFSRARVGAVAVPIGHATESAACGAELGRRLNAPDLAGVLVLSDGLRVNGSDLTRGISSQIPAGVAVSGGLAADGARFERTIVGLDTQPIPGQVVAIGLYGSGIEFLTGSAGGWAAFGPRRAITGSSGNVLHTLDDEPALDLYERYLGEDAADLPSSALLFPLKVFDPLSPEHSVVRTILSVDRAARTMTFAGDVPQGWVAQLMRGNVDRLTNGASDAAGQIVRNGKPLATNTLVLMVSCIGRRLLMGQRTIDEVEAVGAALGSQAVRLGFYAYGEICPHADSGRGEMHNQTMTITAIREAA